MNILVTGGAGFIGSHLINYLISNDHNIVVVDNLSSNPNYIASKEITFIQADLKDKETYNMLPKNIEVVFHLASQASGEVSYEDPIKDLESNTLSSLKLLKWSKENKIKKFIFSSTMGVYKDNLGFPADEDSEKSPKNFYGISKLMTEKHISIFQEDGLNTTIFRLFNVYGPGQNMDNMKQGMISIFIAYLLNKKRISVKGPLSRVRDFIYIDDVISALKEGMKNNTDGKIYNVCTSRNMTVEETLNIIISNFDLNKKDLISVSDRTSRDIDSIWGSYKKIKDEINWKPSVKFEDGIKKTLQSLRKDRVK